jgi:hypothetical protein
VGFSNGPYSIQVRKAFAERKKMTEFAFPHEPEAEFTFGPEFNPKGE